MCRGCHLIICRVVYGLEFGGLVVVLGFSMVLRFHGLFWDRRLRVYGLGLGLRC